MKFRELASRNLLLIGGILIVLGGGLFLVTTGFLPSYGGLWPIVPILLGVLFLYRVYFRDAPEGYIFLANLFLLVGIYFLLNQKSQVELERFWPLFLMIAGITLLLYVSRRDRPHTLSLLIPAWGLTALSVLYLPFSLGVIPISFSTFVLFSWPIIVICIGLILVWKEIRRLKNTPEDGNQDPTDEE